MHLSSYLGLLETGCATLAKSYRQVAEGHAEEADVKRMCEQFASQCDHHEEQLRPFTRRYGSHPSGEPERLHADGLSKTRSGGLGLLRDLHDLYLLASYLDMAWTLVVRRPREPVTKSSFKPSKSAPRRPRLSRSG